jgi:hypothetical protein
MHNLILKSNLEEIATFDDGIRLCEIFDEIRNNSSSKEWS